MFRNIFKGAGVALSVLSLGTMASAGSLAEGMADPEVEDLVLEEEDNSSIGLLPLVGLLVVGAIVLSNNGGDDEPVVKAPPKKE